MFRSALVGLLFAACIGPVLAEELMRVNFSDLHHYWMIDPGQMAPTMPVSLSRLSMQYGGELRSNYKFTVNSEGRPVDYVLLAISPAEASVEADGLRQLQLFRRYRPGTRNPEGRPVRVIANDIRIWTPGVHQRDPAPSKEPE